MTSVSAYPHKCEECTFSTKRKFDLKRHVMQKDSVCQLSFTCAIGGKEYLYKTSLDRHMKVYGES